MSEQWFIVRERVESGPYSLAQLSAMADDGRLLPDDLLRNDAEAEPVVARSLKSRLLSARTDRPTANEHGTALHTPAQADPTQRTPDVIPEGDIRWHYWFDGSQQGPFTWETMQRHARSGLLRASDPVNSSGMAPWVRMPAREVFGLGFESVAPGAASNPSTALNLSASTAAPALESDTANKVLGFLGKVAGVAKNVVGTAWTLIAYYHCSNCDQRAGSSIGEEDFLHHQEYRDVLMSRNHWAKIPYNIFVVHTYVRCENCGNNWTVVSRRATKM